MEQLQALPEGLADRLLPWFLAHARDLPWRRDREPYHVWLSEIMLQQTRVEAVRGYYLRFLEALPQVADLAAAPEQQLLRLWEGLGYYSRVRNLQKAARVILDQYGGAFPTTYAAWRQLPGVGDYTAGAVCSICFDLPTPAVDGNVLRLAARLTGSSAAIDRPEVKRALRTALELQYPPGACGAFTQALMELGAIVCVPNGAPDCAACPLQDLCAARRDGSWDRLPVKTPKKPRVRQDRTVFLLRCGDELAFLKRPDTGLLAGQWEFPNLEAVLEPQQALDQAEAWGLRPQSLTAQVHKTHIFTHIQWHMTGYHILCAARPEAFTWARPGGLPLPTAFRLFLEDKEK